MLKRTHQRYDDVDVDRIDLDRGYCSTNTSVAETEPMGRIKSAPCVRVTLLGETNKIIDSFFVAIHCPSLSGKLPRYDLEILLPRVAGHPPACPEKKDLQGQGRGLPGAMRMPHFYRKHPSRARR